MKKIWTLAVVAALGISTIGCGETAPAPSGDAKPNPPPAAPADGEMTTEKPAEDKPAEEKPAEEKPAEEKPAEEKPAGETPPAEAPK